MAKKISKRVREQAAMICAIAASGGVNGRPYYNMIASELGMDLDEAFMFAVEAWQAAVGPVVGKWTREVDAEAEALIRTGWYEP